MASAAACTRSLDERAAHLEIRDHDELYATLELTAGRMTIGRAEDAAVRLDHDTVSRHHAELIRDPYDRWWIRDLGSQNGTKFKGERLTERLLEDGDTVRVGKFHMGFHHTPPTPATKTEPAVAPIMSDAEHVEIETVEEMEPPRVSASLLSHILELPRQLENAGDMRQRLECLCAFMVHGEFHGQLAVALRLNRERPDQAPQHMCAPQGAARVEIDRQPISRTVLRDVLTRKGAVLGSNTGAEGRQVTMSVSPTELPIAAVACPLRVDAKTMEVLYVTFPPQCALPEWLVLTDLAVRQFQQAEAMRQTNERHRQEAAIQHELDRARAIQARLVPKDIVLPDLDIAVAQEPCMWVGGDYADVVAMPDGRVFLAVADVAGKGLHAALVCMSLHSLIRAGLRAGPSLADLMEGVNQQLGAYLPESSFVTMAAAMLDLREGTGEFANAGHPPVLITDAGGAMHELPSGVGYPLGVNLEPVPIHPLTLKNGDVMTMYTDGWSELQNPAGQLFGLARVRKYVRRIVQEGADIPVSAIIKRMTELMDRFRGQSMPGDDRTILVARRGADRKCAAGPRLAEGVK